MNTTLINRYGTLLEFSLNDTVLFRYIYNEGLVAQDLSPKPWFHPLCTTAGSVLTVTRPHDHRWHQGLAMTCADVSGSNFWGGPTYVRGEGYRHMDNHGRQVHLGFDSVEAAGAGCSFTERLEWVDRDGGACLSESRTVRAQVLPAEDVWTMRISTRLTNTSGRTLDFGSPTTNGRPNAGYGGLFWRGPRDWRGCAAFAAGGLEGQDAIMGVRAPWLAFAGDHDELDRSSTLVFVDLPEDPDEPTKWFCRTDPFAGASFAFSYDEVRSLAPDAELLLDHGLIIADGRWDAARAEAAACDFRSPGS